MTFIVDPAVRCAICGEPISVDDKTVTVDGKPAHEKCFLTQTLFPKKPVEGQK